MYGRESVELFLLAIDEGMRVSEAADFAGVTRRVARTWAAGGLPHSYTGEPRRMSSKGKTSGKAGSMPTKGIYDPPRDGPLAGLSPDQIENLLLRAVLADLKAGGWDPASISNRSKCELGERLRRETGLPLRSITGFLRISKSSYEYQRARMRRAGVVASEKRVRRVMREEGLRPAYARRRRKGYGSYVGEVSKAPGNLVARDFHASAPDELWLTDITEFRLPSGDKAYLSPVVDCFDGKPVAWSIGRRPSKDLANSSLGKAVARRAPGHRTVVHSDRGGHYRWPEWIRICDENGLVRSMSAKGCGPDNAACEGFFGRLKNEFFHHRDWSGVGVDAFMAELDGYMEYYCEGRIKESLGWMSPNEYRRSLGYSS